MMLFLARGDLDLAEVSLTERLRRAHVTTDAKVQAEYIEGALYPLLGVLDGESADVLDRLIASFPNLLGERRKPERI